MAQTSEADYESYYIIRCDPDDIYWNGYTKAPDKDSFQNLFNKRLSSAPFEKPEDRQIYLISLNLEGNSIKIGFIQLIRREDAVEIGYSVLGKYQGHGYATAAVKQAIPIAMQYFPKAIIRIRDDNYPSQRVAMKCGFKRTDIYIDKKYPDCGIVKLRTYVLEKDELSF